MRAAELCTPMGGRLGSEITTEFPTIGVPHSPWYNQSQISVMWKSGKLFVRVYKFMYVADSVFVRTSYFLR